MALTLGTPTAPPARPGDVLEGETPAGFADAVDQLARVAQSIDELASNLNTDASRLLTSLADVVEREPHRARRAHRPTSPRSPRSSTAAPARSAVSLNDPRLYDRVTDTMADVQQSVQDLGAVARNLRDGQGTLGKLLATDDALYVQVQETLDNLAVAARNAQEITDGLRAGEGTLGKALVDASLYEQSLDTLRTANRAAQSVEDQAPISHPRHDRHEPVLAPAACVSRASVRPPETLSTCPVT